MTSKTKQTYLTRITLLHKMQNQYDEVAWREFVSTYQNYIYAIIRGMNINSSDIGDLVQQVFIKLWKKIPEIDLRKMVRFRSYLAVTTKNCVYDYLRKEMRKGSGRTVEYSTDIETLEMMSVPEVNRIANEEWNHYISALAFEKIAPLFSKTAIEVFKQYLEGKDIRETAEELKIGLSTAYRLRGRVKESLRSEIESLNDYLG